MSIRTMDWQDVAALPPAAPQVAGLWSEASLVVLAGAPASFKSWLALDVSLRMVHGMNLRGHRIGPGSVLYLAGEGYSGFGGRLRAWRAHHAVRGPTEGRYLEIANGIPILSRPDGTADLESTLEGLQTDRGHAPQFVVVDTLSQAFGWGDENDASTVAQALRGLSELRIKFACSFLILHHLSKGPQGSTAALTLNSVRGSSALTANADAVLLCRVHDDVQTVSVAKLKDGVPAQPMRSILVPVVTGLTLPDGSVETGAALAPAEAGEGQQTQGLESDRAVAEALASAGEEGATRSDLHDVTGLARATLWACLQRLLVAGDAVGRKEGARWRYWHREFAPDDGDSCRSVGGPR